MIISYSLYYTYYPGLPHTILEAVNILMSIQYNIPVIYAALLFKIPGGFLGGIVAGIVMGPIMPLDAEIGVMQSFSTGLSGCCFL